MYAAQIHKKDIYLDTAFYIPEKDIYLDAAFYIPDVYHRKRHDWISIEWKGIYPLDTL
jgi:hypothetical protein